MLSKEVAQTILKALIESNQIDAPYHQSAMSLMQQIADGDMIADVWDINDVQEASNMEHGYEGDDDHREIELDTAREVLEMASNKMDANMGINWEWLQYCLDSVEAGE